MHIRRVVAFVVLAGALSGCFLFLPWATDRDIEGSYDQVFQATLETLEARDFPLKHVDWDDGLIEAGRRPADGGGSHRRVKTVRAKIKDEGDGEVSVQLLMTFFESGDRQFSEVTDRAVDRSTIYDDYLDAIAARV